MRYLYSSSQKYYCFHYPNRDKGIHWILRYGNISPGFIKPNEVDRPCSIKATINPKILTGEQDYLAASTSNYLDEVESLFNAEARTISPLLGEFKHYGMSRPDYCVNFDLKELAIPCTAEQMIYLIKHGDIPRHYSEYAEYDEVSKRKKSDKDSFYLESNSVTINCYRKRKQLMENFQDCPNLEDARHIIRFEVQCGYLKTYALSKNLAQSGVSTSDIIREMLSEDFCAEIIRDYFERVIRRGDYYTLDGAIKQVQLRHFRRKKEERLINGLRMINQFRGIHKVKAALQDEELKTFRRTLSDLANINVNPVTIPREWNIPRIPNLLAAYERSIDDELIKIYLNEMDSKIIYEIFKEKKKLFNNIDQ